MVRPGVRGLNEPQLVGSPVGAAIAGALLTRSVKLTLLVAASCAVIGGIWPTVLPASSYEPLAQGAAAT